MHTATSILRKKNIRQGSASKKVVFPKYNKAAEEDRRLRGVRLRKQLRKEKELNKISQNGSARRVYAALVDPGNLVGLNTLATHNRSFRVELLTVFGDIAALPNANIDPQQVNALGVLNALIAANLPFPNIAGDPNIQDVLDMIGALERFRPFLNPPPISDGSDHDGVDGKHDDDGNGDDGKKKGNGGNSNVGDKRQRVEKEEKEICWSRSSVVAR